MFRQPDTDRYTTNVTEARELERRLGLSRVKPVGQADRTFWTDESKAYPFLEQLRQAARYQTLAARPGRHKDVQLKNFPQRIRVVIPQPYQEILKNKIPYVPDSARHHTYALATPGEFTYGRQIPNYREPGIYGNKSQIKNDFKTIAEEYEAQGRASGLTEPQKQAMRQRIERDRYVALKGAQFRRVGNEQGYYNYMQMFQELSPQQQDEIVSRSSSESRERRGTRGAQEQISQWNTLHPVERRQISVNRQVADLIGQAQVNQHNQQIDFFTPKQLQQENVSPMMLQEIMNQSHNGQNRYVPVKPRRSVNDRVMSSFDPRMFSPEFIPEEENGY